MNPSTDEMRQHWREKQRRFRVNNPEKNKGYCKRWREANRSKHRESALKNYRRNRSTWIERTRKWHRDNAERRREYRRKYYKTHPAYGKVHCSNRRARKRMATIGNVRGIERIYSRAEWWRQWFDVVVDHITPLSLGGTHEPSNLQIIYKSENLKKSNRLAYRPRVVFAH